MEVDISLEGVKEAEKMLKEFPRRVPGAVSNAINRSLTNMRANARKEVRQNYEIKAKDFNRTIKRKNSTRSTLAGAVTSEGQIVPLDRFKVSPKTVQPRRKAQLKITIKKGETKQITGAFVANIHGIKIFRRKTNKRNPIDRLFGPSVPQMLGKESVVKEIERKGMDMFRRRLDHEVHRILERHGG